MFYMIVLDCFDTFAHCDQTCILYIYIDYTVFSTILYSTFLSKTSLLIFNCD